MNSDPIVLPRGNAVSDVMIKNDIEEDPEDDSTFLDDEESDEDPDDTGS